MKFYVSVIIFPFLCLMVDASLLHAMDPGSYTYPDFEKFYIKNLTFGNLVIYAQDDNETTQSHLFPQGFYFKHFSPVINIFSTLPASGLPSSCSLNLSLERTWRFLPFLSTALATINIDHTIDPFKAEISTEIKLLQNEENLRLHNTEQLLSFKKTVQLLKQTVITEREIKCHDVPQILKETHTQSPPFHFQYEIVLENLQNPLTILEQ